MISKVIIPLLILVGVGGFFYYKLFIPTSSIAQPSVIHIKEGISSTQIGDLLHKRGLIKDPLLFNLYRGLLPSAIASPSIDSVEAALYPAKVDYLYFVLADNGRHVFENL